MVFLSVLLQIRHAAIFEWGTALCTLDWKVDGMRLPGNASVAAAIFEWGTALYQFKM